MSTSLRLPIELRMQWLPLLSTSLLLSAVAAQMPYNPTRLLQNNDTLYVFRPSSQSSTQFALSTIDLSFQVKASNLPYNTLYATLPFLDDNAPRAFTPVLDHDGNLTVYTGDCTLGASGGELWSFVPDTSENVVKGSWSKQDVSVVDSSHTSIMGANYLSGGMTFSSIVGGNAANTGAYFFGGMCPDQNDTTSDWQSAANYSNFMVTLQPSEDTSKPLNYDIDVSSSRGPPIPEAGFTITGLSPTYSDRSDGTQIQQQNFVLIGGHTSAAFINMSQIALFSLPEQGWTFIGVDQPDTSRTDLAIRADVTSIDPRSGHTAVLSPDGQQIIVVGGWVGDINTPADPQLALLSVADGYGGAGDWQWVVPSTTGTGLPNDGGLYGHGAAMLPGGVLMITGGYSISSSGTQRRDAAPAANTQTYFLNVTSNTWISDYTPPAKESPSESASSGLLSTTGQKAGLGVGVGIGLAAICGVFALYMWYARRMKKRREFREKQLQEISYTTHRYNAEDYPQSFDGRGGNSDALDYITDQNGPYYFPAGTQGGQGWKATNRGDVERTGLLVEIPSPTRGLRRNLSGRPQYAMGRPRGPGSIHPIDELEEEPDEESAHDNNTPGRHQEMTETRRKSGSAILDNAPVLDPFTESPGRNRNTLHSASPSPQHQSYEVNTNSAGRLSPDKSTSERTSSNLSERSTLSWTSSNGGVGRSASMRSGPMLNTAMRANPFKTPDTSPTHDKPGRLSPEDPRTQSFSSLQGEQDVDSFRTAQSSFSRLQAEGEVLLGGNPERSRPDTSSSGSTTHRDSDRSNSRAATATPATSFALDLSSAPRPATRERRMSWLGSVRRVLTRSVSSAERTRSLTTAPTYHEPYRDDPTSPVDPFPRSINRKSLPAPATTNSTPQRAASDASFWRNRRGKQDWLEEEQDPAWRRTAGDDWGAPEDIAILERERARQEWRERGSNLLVTINSEERLPTPRTPISPDQLGVPPTHDRGDDRERPCTPASEADWDVEAAVERRVVQVMFTVPKSKLRVVNADIDGASILSDVPPRDAGDDNGNGNGKESPTRVKDLAGRFEQMSGSGSRGGSPRMSPRPSPSNSIKSLKVRGKASQSSLAREVSVRSKRLGSGAGMSPLGNGKGKEKE
ncbi:uncharacterized protein J4E87_003304 [Alternaria ethzedia]|uniref:uncharacterized protein n=1 Tax=Alternaria ethzedia TaxID=181014 RepID=UPI0020C4D7E1|nr:uncharacterized protein J4E87_003304 [Alternaria ethzedia]KAI4629044.1 hypothetical protein J4E87_003304 [Alternaria ethzedia]